MGKGASKAPKAPPVSESLVDEYTPWGNSVYTPTKGDDDRYRLDVQLTPAQRRLFEQEQQLNQGLNQLAIDQTGRLSGHMGRPVSFSGAPDVDGGRIQSSLSTSGMPGMRDLNSQGLPGTRDLNSSGLSPMRGLSSAGMTDVRRLSNGMLPGVQDLTTRGLSDIPGIDDFGGERQRVEDAMYARSASRLDPQMQQQQRQIESRLAAQGITAGSAAHRQALDDFARRQTDAYSTARNEAIMAGGGEQSRLFGDALAGRGQQFGERQAVTAADLAERGQLFGERERVTASDLAQRGQQFGERQGISAADIARRGQQFGERQAGSQMALANRGQLFGERQAGSQMALANRGQMFGERQAQGAFGNLAQQQQYDQQAAERQRYIDELLAQRNQPINEIAALMGAGGGVQQPQFRGSGEVGNTAAQQYQAQLAGWQNQQQGRQNTMGGLFGLGGNLGAAYLMGGR